MAVGHLSDVLGDAGRRALDVGGLRVAVASRPRASGAQAGVGQEDQVAYERVLDAVLHCLPQAGVLDISGPDRVHRTVPRSQPGPLAR